MARTAARSWILVPDWTADHPEWWALGLSAAAWAAMLSHGAGGHGWALCLSPSGHTDRGFIANISVSWRTGVLSDRLLGWAIMTLAMMPPLAVPLIRHVAVRNFSARRHRAVSVFLAGLLGVWLLFGIAGLPLLAAVPADLLANPAFPAAGFLIAAAWQFAPAKRVALLRCHRTVPFEPFGWRADLDCFRYGLAHGLDCLTSCWASMLSLVLASHGALVCLGVQCIALAERRARLPRAGLSALAFVVCALLMLLRLPL